MDLRLEGDDTKELVVIRSSSCVIKIRETSSVFKSCRSDSSSESHETRIFQDVKSTKKVSEHHEPVARSTRRDGFSEDTAMNEQNENGSQEEMESTPSLSKSVMKLIAPSVADIVQVRSSHRMNEYDMIDILIQVLNELKSDCKNIFEKREHDSRDENSVKLIIRECFTEIMARYSTELPSSSRGISYNRCQKIISRSIKSLTLECVDIIERAICKQAKIMRQSRFEKESAKSLLVKLMQIIQIELNKSKPVLKVVNTELHQPSFLYIFGLLKYFIEKSAQGFKIFRPRSNEKVLNGPRKMKGAGEVSDSEISISVADEKLNEYASRLDRLLEKVSNDSQLQDNAQLVIDCYHCTTKCKEQDLLLKTVTRFTEEIKQELINHARVVHEGSHYSYIGMPKGKTSREVSLSSPEMSTLESRTRTVQGDTCTKRSNSMTPCSSPTRNLAYQPNTCLPTECCPKNQKIRTLRQSANIDTRRNSISPTVVNDAVQKHKICPQQQDVRNNINKLCTKHEHSEYVKYSKRSPSNCLFQNKIQDIDSDPSHGSQKYRAHSCLRGGSAASTEKCRYCSSNAASNKLCAYDNLKIECASKKVIAHDSTQIYESGASHDRLPKPPLIEKSRFKAIPEYVESNHKIIPKQEQGLVKKSKPGKDENSKEVENPKPDAKSVKGDKLSSGNKKSVSSKDETKRKSKTPERKILLENVTSRKEEDSRSPEQMKPEPKESSHSLPKEQTLKFSPSANFDPLNDKKPEPPKNEAQKTGKDLKQDEERTNVNEQFLGVSIIKADQEKKGKKDPAFCCQMNCNCSNKRGEQQQKDNSGPPKRDSMNQTDQKENSSCCKGCNCDQNSTPVFINGCFCKSGNPQDGDMALRPIYQFFANPVPIPCKCQETAQNKEQKEAQTSKPATPKSDKRDSHETGTQTSANQLNKAPSHSETSSSVPSSSAPSKSAPSSSAPSTYATSSGPSGYNASSNSEPSYLKSSTSHRTTSSTLHTGKSDSMLSCTCSMDKGPSECADTQTSRNNVKDACTSDTNCCCPEKLEEVFQEFDDKYSQVVKEIKFLIREGYIPLYRDETHELTGTASRLLPTAASTKTATCQCTRDSCKKCRGDPTSALSRKSAYSQKERCNFDIADNCEEGSQNGNYESPRKQVKYDSGNKNKCEEPPHQYASKDTFIYNDLQKDIHDLKELVKMTRFGNCPCCKCCKCEPENSGKPCPTNTDGSRNSPPQEVKNTTKPVTHSAVVCKDTEKQKDVPNKQPQQKSEPSAPQLSEATYFGLKRMSEPRASKEEESITKPSSSNNEPMKKQDSTKEETQLEQPTPPQPIQKDEEKILGHHILSTASKVGKRLSEGVQQYRVNSQDSAHKGPVSGIIAENEDKLKGPEQEREPTLRGIPSKQDDRNPSATKDSDDAYLRASSVNEFQPNSSSIEGSTSKAEAAAEAAKEPTIASISARLNSPENAIETENQTEKNRPNEPGQDENEAKRASPSSPSLVSSSILKEGSKDKVESRTSPKKVEIDEPLKIPSNDAAGSSFGYSDHQESGLTRKSDFGATRKPRQSVSEQVLQKSVSNISFGSKKSALSTTSSKNLVLSPEQEALFQSRERLRGYSSEAQISPSEVYQGTGNDVSDSLYNEAKEPRKQVSTTEDVQPGFFQRIFGGKTKPEISEKSEPSDESESNSDDSDSGDSTADICRTLLDMEPMLCRFWSDETTPPCKNVDTYVMVLETETPNGLAARDETFIIRENIPINANKQLRNEYKEKGRVKKSDELEKFTKGNLIQQSAYLASKSTSTIWKGMTTPIGIIRGLCKLPSGPAPESTVERPTEALKRELSKKVIQKPAKKLVLPMNVSNHYSHVTYKMTRSQDRKRRSAHLRTYSSVSVKKTRPKLQKTEDKEVQVTKWNAMTQTAGPRKFNQTDISKEIEDKLARYLGLERMVEDMSFSLSASSNSAEQTVGKLSTRKKTQNDNQNGKKQTNRK